MIHIKGTVQFQDIETGAWTIISEDGMTYLPTNMPEQLKHDGVKVDIVAVPSDAMSFFMMGELVDIVQFHTLQV